MRPNIILNSLPIQIRSNLSPSVSSFIKEGRRHQPMSGYQDNHYHGLSEPPILVTSFILAVHKKLTAQLHGLSISANVMKFSTCSNLLTQCKFSQPSKRSAAHGTAAAYGTFMVKLPERFTALGIPQ